MRPNNHRASAALIRIATHRVSVGGGATILKPEDMDILEISLGLAASARNSHEIRCLAQKVSYGKRGSNPENAQVPPALRFTTFWSMPRPGLPSVCP